MKTFAIFVSLALLAACATSTEADRRIMKRAPQEDLERLAHFLQTTGDNDYLMENVLTVSWADTESYRVFRFSGLIVFIYPYDWTASNRDISIMIDRGVSGNDFRDHFFEVEWRDNGKKMYSETVAVRDLKPQASIGFRDFIFSSSREDILANYAVSLKGSNIAENEIHQRGRMANNESNFIPFSYGSTGRDNRIDGLCVFRSDLLDSKPVWLRIHNIGMSQLSFFAWGSAGGTPITTVDEGVFQWEPKRSQP